MNQIRVVLQTCAGVTQGIPELPHCRLHYLAVILKHSTGVTEGHAMIPDRMQHCFSIALQLLRGKCERPHASGLQRHRSQNVG